MKTTTKIALTMVLFNSVFVLVFGSAVYYFLNNYSYLDFYKRLETRASIAARYNLQSDALNAEAIKKLRDDHLERLPKEREFIAKVGSEKDLDSLALQLNLPSEFLLNIWEKGKATHKGNNSFYSGIRYSQGNYQHLVIVSAEHYYASHHLQFLRTIILIGVVLIVLLGLGFAFYFSKTIFRPIVKITEDVKRISTDNMHLRLEKKEDNSEIAELTSTFNDLLNRIETAFETQKNFISNASHELGTPLTAIIGEADVTLNKPRSVGEYQATLKNILAQADRLDQITKSLLFLAQTGYSHKKLNFEIIRTDELIWEVKNTIDKLNPQNQIYIDFSLFPEDPKKLKVKGNRQLLMMAFANLLNNACKYSQNKPVNVSIASALQEIIILIKDQGIGIPENELQFIYDPFFRASNTGYFEGYGIGLPLARNIFTLHKGSIKVSSVMNAGTTVQVRLPQAFLI